MKPNLLALAITMALNMRIAGASSHRVLRLADGDSVVRRVISNAVELAEGVQRSTVTITRTGSFTDPRYGRFEITAKMLSDMVRNFNARTFGQDVFVDVAHQPVNGSAAKVVRLFTDGSRLRADVEWTGYGIDAVRNKGFRYLSAEFDENFHDNEKGASHGCVLCGAGLTIRPVIKNLDPVTLAATDDSDFSGPVYVHPGLVRQLSESHKETAMNRWKKFLARLQAAGIVLSAAALASLEKVFGVATKALAEDAETPAEIGDELEGIAKQLAAAPAGSTIQLSVNAAAPTVDSKTLAEAVTKELADRETAAKAEVKKLADVRKVYTDAITAATGLGDDTKKSLSEAADKMIGPQWTEDQAKEFATQQIEVGGRIEAARKLSAMGYHPQGAVRTATGGESSDGKALSEANRKQLAGSGIVSLKLLPEDKLPAFAQRYLAQFDADNAHRLANEVKLLSGGPVDSGDTKLPASFEREVIREALSDLNILNLVDSAVEPTTAPTHTIFFETRDVTQVINDGIVAEGQPIPFGGIKQDSEYAYINAMKLAMNLTNEVIFFTQNNPNLNWDAWARTLDSNARVLREKVQRRIGNFLQHAADAYGAVQVMASSVPAATAAGGNYKFANFPVVRAHQPRDLKGNAVGTLETPLVIRDGGTPIGEYDGSGTQAAGNYWRMSNWNLGYLQIVNQAGVLQAGRTITSDFYYATNIAKVDLDIAAGLTYEKQLNKVIQAIGARKAMMSSQRYVVPNAQLMSPVFNDLATNAEQFTAQGKRNGADTTSMGDLDAIKGIPSWASNAPSVDMGDDRTILMERGLLRYRIAKTYSVGAPFEAVDATTGKPIGKKIAYGEEYSSIWVPTPLRNRLSSVVAYSVTGRAAF